MSYLQALKKYNEGKAWCVPRKGTPEYDTVISIMSSMRSSEESKKQEPKKEEPKKEASIPRLKEYQKGQTKPEKEHLERIVLQEYDSNSYSDIGIAYHLDDMLKWFEKKESQAFYKRTGRNEQDIAEGKLEDRFIKDIIAYLNRVKIQHNTGRFVIKQEDWVKVFE